MKFKLILAVDVCEDDFDYVELGEMSLDEIKQFEEMIQVDETEQGYTYEMMKFCIEKKAFMIYLA